MCKKGSILLWWNKIMKVWPWYLQLFMEIRSLCMWLCLERWWVDEIPSIWSTELENRWAQNPLCEGSLVDNVLRSRLGVHSSPFTKWQQGFGSIMICLVAPQWFSCFGWINLSLDWHGDWVLKVMNFGLILMTIFSFHLGQSTRNKVFSRTVPSRGLSVLSKDSF